LGLGGSVFSTDEARADRVAARLEVGMTHVNTIAAEAAEIPFGGVKRSGFGREMGPIGMGEFVNKRLHFVAKCGCRAVRGCGPRAERVCGIAVSRGRGLAGSVRSRRACPRWSRW